MTIRRRFNETKSIAMHATTPAIIPHPKPAASARRLWIIGSGAALVLAALIVLLVLSRRDTEPRLNDTTAVLAKFVTSKQFDAMPYEKQRLYYKVLDDRADEIDQLFKQGKLTDADYRAALETAWLGKHINRVEKYVSLPAGNARANYIAQLLTKKAKKDAAKMKNGLDEADDIRVDETAASLRVESWPANVRDQWNLFHAAYRQEKKLRDTPTTRSVRKRGNYP